MKTTLIISTYNWERALSLCLESVARQQRMPDEVLIADDGSREPTRLLVENIASTFPVPLRHIWHEDLGFRLSAIRNRAMAAAEGDYLIQIDGDLILHPQFIEDHISAAERGFFVVGSRVVLGEKISAGLLDGSVSPQELGTFSPDLRNRSNSVRCRMLSRLFRLRRGHGARGCNMAFWRDDVKMVNGYDEMMTGWGHEDSEFAERLRNAGIRQHSLKFGGIAYHLHHGQSSREHENVNLDILRNTVESRKVRCENGIDAYL